MRRRLLILTCLLSSTLLGMTASASAVEPAGRAPEESTGPRPYSLLQMNLCLSGLAGCYPGTEYPAVVDEAIERILAEEPQAVTLNEACSGDVERIARETGMRYRFATVIYRGAPLPCVRPENRGVFGNAVLVNDDILSTEDQAFRAQSGVEERRYLCVTTEGGVRVCTSHLSVSGTPEQAATNEAQCRELTNVLAGDRQEATIFGGDVNRQKSCAPKGFWTLRDSEATQAPGIQHAYGLRERLLQPKADIVPMTYTDHDGLLVHTQLRSFPTPDKGDEGDKDRRPKNIETDNSDVETEDLTIGGPS